MMSYVASVFSAVYEQRGVSAAEARAGSCSRPCRTTTRVSPRTAIDVLPNHAHGGRGGRCNSSARDSSQESPVLGVRLTASCDVDVD